MNKHLVSTKIILLIVCCATFTLSAQYALASPGSITVYSPNPGDVYYEGGQVTISWSYYDTGDYIKIELYRGGSYYNTITTNTSIYEGSYSWTIPAGYSSDIYYFQIRITSLTYPSDYGYSGTFYIYQKYITVTSPTGGETLFQGDTNTITWSSENAGSYVKIELYKSGSYSTIASGTSNSGSYYWTIPSNQPLGSSYQIKVTDFYDNSIYDFSEYFTIDERTITITSPAGGETWYRGEKNTIKWTSKNVGSYVKIEYSRGSFSYYVITSGASNTGSYEWNIPGDATLDSQYRIKISSYSYSSIYDVSNYFSIDERYIQIVVPTSGYRWYPNETYTISWNSKNAGNNVGIKLYRNNVYCATIVSNTANSGSYSWTISGVFAPGSDYTIEVRSKEFSVVYGSSYEFSIGERSIIIISPTGGELWHKGEKHTITWNTENAGSTVNIELYKNEKKYSTIISDLNNQGSYNWQIPNDLPSGSYQIKITSSQYADVYAFSEGNITFEETILQKLTTPLMAIIIVVVFVTVAYKLFMRAKRKKLEENIIDQKQLMQPQELIGQTEITQDDYEKIWEKNKP